MSKQFDEHKRQAHNFWNRTSSIEDFNLIGSDCAAYKAQAKVFYQLELFIEGFIQFESPKSGSIVVLTDY